jgi:hypothetical protein
VPDDPDDDFAHRELCPDGTCIGVIGPDGRCRVCGAVGPEAIRDPRHRGLDLDRAAAPPPPPPLAADADGFDPDRALCPDGGCVGVIGDGGRCKVCGRAATDAP